MLSCTLLLASCALPGGSTASQPTDTPKPAPAHTPTPKPKPPTPTKPAGTGLLGGLNLLVNGDAERGPGTMDGTVVVTDIPGWTTTGELNVIEYGTSGGYPLSTDPGPDNRGKNFFGGGPNDNDAVSTATQTIDVSSVVLALESGNVSYVLTGWLGGYSSQEDNAVLTIQFEDGSGQALGQAQIGPVAAEDRQGATGLLQRTANGKVPKGTRKIVVTLTITRTEGTANDGYADNLSLTLAG